MRNHSVRILAIAATALSLAYGSADAQGKGKGSDKNEKGYEKRDKDYDKRDKDYDKRVRKGRIDDRRDDRRVDMDRRRDDGRVIVDRDGRVVDGRIIDGRVVDGTRRRVPPGLAKKPGQMPPGQYKKRYGTREGATVLGDIFGRNGYEVQRITAAGESQYVYYRLPNGTIERAIVSPGTDRLRFTNVPATLLQEVLRRLY